MSVVFSFLSIQNEFSAPVPQKTAYRQKGAHHFSRTDVPCFPSGSGFAALSDMAVSAVWAICLSRRRGINLLGDLNLLTTCVAQKKRYKAPRTTCCLRVPISLF